jgi:hypothetical protein
VLVNYLESETVSIVSTVELIPTLPYEVKQRAPPGVQLRRLAIRYRTDWTGFWSRLRTLLLVGSFVAKK